MRKFTRRCRCSGPIMSTSQWIRFSPILAAGGPLSKLSFTSSPHSTLLTRCGSGRWTLSESATSPTRELSLCYSASESACRTFNCMSFTISMIMSRREGTSTRVRSTSSTRWFSNSRRKLRILKHSWVGKNKPINEVPWKWVRLVIEY